MDTLKEIFEKKSTRFLLFAILIILLVIILIVLVFGGSGAVNESNIVNAAKSYYAAYPSALPKEKYESKTVMLSTLVASGYLSNKLDGASCPSYVIVTNMNGAYEYTPVLSCSNTPLVKLYSKLKSTTTSSGSGLYNTTNGYIYRGANPNNYVKFADSLWRIVSIDNDGNIKMIYSDIALQDSYVAWDERYNADFIYPDSYIDAGKNDYNISNLRSYLDNIFSLYPEKFTGNRIARLATYDICTGKFGAGNTNLCSTKVTDTYTSIISINDYIKASLDKQCKASSSKFCRNDNYLHEINNNCWTITADSSNTYSAYYIDEYEGIASAWAYIKHCTKPIISLKNTVLYVSGNGTLENPYQIG